MSNAADNLAEGVIDDAVNAQASALDLLNNIYMAVAPFTNLLHKAEYQLVLRRNIRV